MKTIHYFDWAATTPPDEQIVNEVLKSNEAWANPSSLHSLGKESKNALEGARSLCARTLGVSEKNLFFTSGGTEANHIPILSQLNKYGAGSIIVSAIEHPSVMEQCLALKKCGWNIITVLPNKSGIIESNAIIEKLQDDTKLVCVMAVNNETGAVQPIQEISQALNSFSDNKRKIHLHVDCVQLLGKLPFTLSELGVSSASFSAHKICGIRGSGILYLSNPIEAFLKGGGQEGGIRSGTENILGARIFSKCIEKYFIPNNKNFYLEKQKKITANFIRNLHTLSTCTIIPENRKEFDEHYSPWILQVAFKNIPGQVMLRLLDEKGFCISTGSACSSRKNHRPILEAMSVSPKLRENSVRFSFGYSTSEKEVEDLFSIIKDLCKKFS